MLMVNGIRRHNNRKRISLLTITTPVYSYIMVCYGGVIRALFSTLYNQDQKDNITRILFFIITFNSYMNTICLYK